MPTLRPARRPAPRRSWGQQRGNKKHEEGDIRAQAKGSSESLTFEIGVRLRGSAAGYLHLYGETGTERTVFVMASSKQVKAAKKNVKKAQSGARQKKSIANMPKETRTALGKQAAAVAQRRRSGGSGPKTRQELYEEAERRNIKGRSKMGRDELARALGHK